MHAWAACIVKCTTSTFIDIHRAWAALAASALPAQYENWVVCYSSAQLSSMQSSSSFECTLKWKHNLSSSHSPILRVATVSVSVNAASYRSPWLHVARAFTPTLSTQQASLNQIVVDRLRSGSEVVNRGVTNILTSLLQLVRAMLSADGSQSWHRLQERGYVLFDAVVWNQEHVLFE